MTTIADIYPVLGLRIRAGELELRGITDDDLVTLGALAQGGVHELGSIPFAHMWTDAPHEEMSLGMAQFHWSQRAKFSKDAWSLELGVWERGELVGVQGLSATDYLATS